MKRHKCTGDDCRRCEEAAEQRTERDADPTAWQVGQNRYEAHLDRMGGSR